MAKPPEYDTRPQFFVKMFKDGNYDCTPVTKGREELDQNTMELEYIPEPPTEDEKIEYALTQPNVMSLMLTDEQKLGVATSIVQHPDFIMPVVFDPNGNRVHDDPEYFFKTPAKPVIWTLKRGSPDEAIAEAQGYLKQMVDSGKWDMVVAVYKAQYNVVEV